MGILKNKDFLFLFLIHLYFHLLGNDLNIDSKEIEEFKNVTNCK